MAKPVDDAFELVKKGIKISDCKMFLMGVDKEIESDDFRYVRFLEGYTIDTKERVRKYLDYNLKLSGGSYGSSIKDWNRDACSQEVKDALEEMGK